MPILPRDGHSCDADFETNLYVPGRIDAGPTLEDWADYLAYLDSVGGLFPDDQPESDEPFEPLAEDVEWIDAATRPPTA